MNIIIWEAVSYTPQEAGGVVDFFLGSLPGDVLHREVCLIKKVVSKFFEQLRQAQFLPDGEVSLDDAVRALQRVVGVGVARRGSLEPLSSRRVVNPRSEEVVDDLLDLHLRLGSHIIRQLGPLLLEEAKEEIVGVFVDAECSQVSDVSGQT